MQYIELKNMVSALCGTVYDSSFHEAIMEVTISAVMYRRCSYHPGLVDQWIRETFMCAAPFNEYGQTRAQVIKMQLAAVQHGLIPPQDYCITHLPAINMLFPAGGYMPTKETLVGALLSSNLTLDKEVKKRINRYKGSIKKRNNKVVF